MCNHAHQRHESHVAFTLLCSLLYSHLLSLYSQELDWSMEPPPPYGRDRYGEGSSSSTNTRHYSRHKYPQPAPPANAQPMLQRAPEPRGLFQDPYRPFYITDQEEDFWSDDDEDMVIIDLVSDEPDLLMPPPPPPLPPRRERVNDVRGLIPRVNNRRDVPPPLPPRYERVQAIRGIPMVIMNRLHEIHPYDGVILSKRTNLPIGFLQTNGYLQVQFGRQKRLFHRYMYECCHNVQLTDRDMIDHIDQNKLNNRIDNLRLTDGSGNNQNRQRPHRRGATSRFRGVHRTPDNRWVAGITINRVRHYLGTFNTEIQAARAYRARARRANREEGTRFFMDPWL